MPNQKIAQLLMAYIQDRQNEMEALLARLVRLETPSTAPETQEAAFVLLAEVLRDLGFEPERIPGRETGGLLLARPAGGEATPETQLLIGHCDTVWPVGTLAEMPLIINENEIRGPGVFDMKAGLVQMLFALAALKAHQLTPPLTPVVLINADEEIGSEDSTPHIIREAQAAARAFILEPALGPEGRLKTARKGTAEYEVLITGRAAHAGLDPGQGRSAIVEMAHVIQKVAHMHRPEEGIYVNVGRVQGGTRANVVAAECRAAIDVRVNTNAEARQMQAALAAIRPETPGTTISMVRNHGRGPLEPNARNQALWREAQRLGALLGLALQEGAVGGGSDGNTTSQYTATLDGLGPVGDGAHARHEFIYRDKMAERAALLALLLMSPVQAR